MALKPSKNRLVVRGRPSEVLWELEDGSLIWPTSGINGADGSHEVNVLAEFHAHVLVPRDFGSEPFRYDSLIVELENGVWASSRVRIVTRLGVADL